MIKRRPFYHAKGAFSFFAAGFSSKYFFLDTDGIVCYFYKSIFKCVGSFKAHQEGFDNHPKILLLFFPPNIHV